MASSSSMIIQHNIPAMNVHRNMSNSGIKQAKASEKLASGYRINTAADDAAGLAISEKMRAQIRGLDQSSKNVSDAISLIKTAEGGMQGIDDMLHRIRELVDYGSNDTNENNKVGTGDRQKIQDEIDQLTEEIDAMSERVEFNKKKLINGSFQDTTQQLSNAKELFDRTSVERDAATARYTALTDALDAAKTDLTNNQNDLDRPLARAVAVPPAVGAVIPTTPGGAVAGAGTSGAIAVYKEAVTAYTTAEITYTEQLNNYNEAKQALTEALGDAQIADVSSLTTFHFETSNAGGKYVGAEKAAAIKSTLKSYNDAAKTLGLDELNLQGLDPTVWSDPTVMDTAVQVQAVAAGTNDTAANDGTAATAGAALNKSDAPVANKGIDAFNTAKDTFTAATLTYETFVAARDQAQSKVDSINEQLTDQVRTLNSVNKRLNAASVSYDAADKLDQLGNSRALHFQVGANGGQSLIMSIGSLKSDTLGIGNGNGKSYINVLKDSGTDITATIDVLDQALSYVTTERSKLGAAQNRMEYTQQSLDITSENISDAESRIRDTDMAKEMMNYTKANILQQAAVSMMAQANQTPQNVLQLLR